MISFKRKIKSILYKRQFPFKKRILYENLQEIYYLPKFNTKTITHKYLEDVKDKKVFVMFEKIEIIKKICRNYIYRKCDVNWGFSEQNMPDSDWMNSAFMQHASYLEAEDAFSEIEHGTRTGKLIKHLEEINKIKNKTKKFITKTNTSDREALISSLLRSLKFLRKKTN
jgi:hypothetical protein